MPFKIECVRHECILALTWAGEECTITVCHSTTQLHIELINDHKKMMSSYIIMNFSSELDLQTFTSSICT